MAKYARVEGTTVLELFFPPAGFTLEDCFHANIINTFIEVPMEDIVLPGYTYNPTDGTFAPPPEPKAEEPAPVEGEA